MHVQSLVLQCDTSFSHQYHFSKQSRKLRNSRIELLKVGIPKNEHRPRNFPKIACSIPELLWNVPHYWNFTSFPQLCDACIQQKQMLFEMERKCRASSWQFGDVQEGFFFSFFFFFCEMKNSAHLDCSGLHQCFAASVPPQY